MADATKRENVEKKEQKPKEPKKTKEERLAEINDKISKLDADIANVKEDVKKKIKKLTEQQRRRVKKLTEQQNKLIVRQARLTKEMKK